MRTKNKILTTSFILGAIGGFITGVCMDNTYDDNNNKWAVGSTGAALGGLSLLAITWLTASCIQKCKHRISGRRHSDYMQLLLDEAYDRGFTEGRLDIIARTDVTMTQQSTNPFDYNFDRPEGEGEANDYAYLNMQSTYL